MNYRLCAMFLVPSTALVAALLFAVHPIHTEAVSVFPPPLFFFFLSFSIYLSMATTMPKTEVVGVDHLAPV